MKQSLSLLEPFTHCCRAHPPPGVSHELEILFKSKVASYQEKVLQASMAGAELEEVETLYRSVLTPLKEQQNGRDWASPLTKLRSLGSNEENRSPQPFARSALWPFCSRLTFHHYVGVYGLDTCLFTKSSLA